MVMPVSHPEKKYIFGIKDIVFLLSVFLILNLVVVIPVSDSALGETKKIFIIEAIIPILVVSVIFSWLKKKKVNCLSVGLCIPSAGLFRPAIVSIFSAVAVKLIDYSFFTGSLADLDWNRYSIPAAFFLPMVYGIGRIVITPFAEELIFRGVLYGYLRNRFGWKIGLVVQAIIFTMVHPQVYQGGFGTLCVYFLFGVVFGFLYQYYESLYPSFLCHCALNYTGTFLHFLSIV